MNPLLDLLSAAGYVLDTPGALLRGVLAGRPGERVGGRELLEGYGLVNPNQEGLDLGDVGGFAADMVLDPLNLVGGGAMAKRFLAKPSLPAARGFAEAATGVPFESTGYRIGPRSLADRTGVFWGENEGLVRDLYGAGRRRGMPLESATVRLDNPYVMDGFIPQHDLIERLSREGVADADRFLPPGGNWYAPEASRLPEIDTFLRRELGARGFDGAVYRGDPMQGGNEVVSFGIPARVPTPDRSLAPLMAALVARNLLPREG